MIQRRQFIGSLAALFATSSALPRPASAEPFNSAEGLNWRCDIIRTVAHNRAQRNPVVTGVSLQPGGNLLAIVGDDHYVCIYDTIGKRYTEHLKSHSDWVRTAKFSPNGTLLATAGNDRELKIWATGIWSKPVIKKRHPEAIIESAFSNDGSKLATVGFERTLRVYDTKSGQLTQNFTCACRDNHAVAFSNDGTTLAAGGRCGTIRVWNLATQAQVAQFKAHKQRIRSIQFTAEGKIVSASEDQMIRITDPSNPQGGTTLPRHASKLYSTALLTSGLLATGGSDNQIHIWNLRGLKEVGPLKGHTGTVSCLDYSSGQLVSGSYDTEVRLWQTETHTSAPRQTKLQDGAGQNGWSRRIN